MSEGLFTAASALTVVKRIKKARHVHRCVDPARTRSFPVTLLLFWSRVCRGPSSSPSLRQLSVTTSGELSLGRKTLVAKRRSRATASATFLSLPLSFSPETLCDWLVDSRKSRFRNNPCAVAFFQCGWCSAPWTLRSSVVLRLHWGSACLQACGIT